MQINIPLPFDRSSDPSSFFTLDGVAKVGAAIEKAGFAAACVTDHPCPTGRWLDAGGHYAQDPFVMLSLVASATKTVKLQTGILVLPYRNPFITARSIASLDRFSGGRVQVGVGAGYLKGEYRALGVDFEQRLPLMDEYLRALAAALTGEEFTFEGTGYTAFGNRIQPGPVQTPRPPLLVGGNARGAIRRAVDLADGWYPFFTVGGVNTSTTRTAEITNEEQLFEAIDYLRAYSAEVGREKPPQVSVGSIVKPGERWEPQMVIDRAGQFAEKGLVAAGMNVEGRTRAEWCDNVERFGEVVIAKLAA